MCDLVYIGVLVDDFCMFGIKELYCVFIFCVEYCLLLCEDNVDMCLMLIVYDLGLIDEVCWVCFNDKMENIEKEYSCLK